MNDSYDLVSVGDCSLDTFLTPSEAETLCEINTKDCLVCFSYGDKIPVESLDFSVGGNAANNAVGGARLGLKTGIITTIGGDILGREIFETLTAEGVHLEFVTKNEKGKSNFSTVINYSGERTILSYHAPKEYVFPKEFPEAKWVYLTSMGEGYEDFTAKLLEYLEKHPEVNLAVNPGSKQLRSGLELLKPILFRTQVLYVNREEAQKITGIAKSVGAEKNLLEGLLNMGPHTAIVTDGPSGAYVSNGQSYLFCPIFPSKVASRTGAGDAFGSATLTALIKGKTLEEALLWGAVNSASVIGQVGAQKGLLREEEMNQWLIKANEAGVTVRPL